MHRLHNERFLLPPRGRRTPAGLARRHSHRWVLARWASGSSTFLRSLRSRPVTALPRSYGRSDSCPLRRGSARVSSRRPPNRLLSGQVSLIHVLGLPALPPPTTPRGPGIALARYAGHARPPRESFPGFGLRPQPAGSPLTHGRIEFVILRTGRSPPVALHPVLRRRSYHRLQLCAPEEDFHLSGHARFQAHRSFAALRMTCSKVFGTYL